MHSTLRGRRGERPGAVVSSVAWFVTLFVLTPLVSLVGIAKRGGHLEGWGGDSTEQLVGWTLLAAAYVFVPGILALLGYLAATHLLDVSRRASLALATILALGIFRLLAYHA